MSPVRILVVEDEPLIRLFVVDTLEDAGFKVEEAANAVEAARRLAESPSFNAVIIDVGLPDKRGDVFAEELRETRKELPIVIATGHDKSVLAQKFCHDAHVQVLGKPFYGDMLLAALGAMGVTVGPSE